MIEHIWSVLCANSIIDRDSNNLSLIDTLEQINIPPDVELPIVIGNPFTLVTLWSRSDLEVAARGRAHIRIIGPTGNPYDLPEYEIDLANYRRYRNRSNFQGVQIIAPGKHVFEIHLIDDGSGDGPGPVARIPLEVRLTNPENPE